MPPDYARFSLLTHALRPDYPEAHDNLGVAWQMLGKLDDAIAAHRRALAIQPRLVNAHNNLGVAFSKKGQPDDAIESFQRALQIEPHYPQAYVGLGNECLDKGDNDQAIAFCQRALALKSDYTDAHKNLGRALMEKGQMDQAMACFQRALALAPGDPDSLNNLGSASAARRDFIQAEQFFCAAMAASADHVLAHWNLGVLLLLWGDYQNELPLYEWRKKLPNLAAAVVPGPQWDGSNLAGRRILIHFEQAFGDVIQCARYIPQIARRGGKVILAVPDDLTSLLRCFDSIAQVVSLNNPPPSFDVHCSIMSLPLAFKTTLQTIPAEVPYLGTEAKLKRQWQARLPGDDRLKVGLAWSGQRTPDPHRSVPAADLSPLSKLDRVWFCSLHKPAASPAPDFPVADFSEDIDDFADTAALIDNLDLVITIDTSIAHLAGALGKKVWVLLKDVPDWRWLLDRTDSPWYPTMRLFRQATPGQWQTPIRQIVEELGALQSGCQITR